MLFQHVAPEIAVQVTVEHEAGDFSDGKVTDADNRYLIPKEQLDFADTEAVDLTNCEDIDLIPWAKLPVSSSNYTKSTPKNQSSCLLVSVWSSPVPAVS